VLSAREPSPRGHPSLTFRFQPFRYPPAPLRQTRLGIDSIEFVNPTPFEVSNEALEGGVRVLAVRGELDLNTAPELQAPLEEALENGGASILIDLSDCDFIDSTGIAVIVRAWQRVGEGDGDDGGGDLVLCCSNDQVQRLLKITGVESSISILPDRDAALDRLRD
jgi:anti-sigma B factor antagonist